MVGRRNAELEDFGIYILLGNIQSCATVSSSTYAEGNELKNEPSFARPVVSRSPRNALPFSPRIEDCGLIKTTGISLVQNVTRFISEGDEYGDLRAAASAPLYGDCSHR